MTKVSMVVGHGATEPRMAGAAKMGKLMVALVLAAGNTDVGQHRYQYQRPCLSECAQKGLFKRSDMAQDYFCID